VAGKQITFSISKAFADFIDLGLFVRGLTEILGVAVGHLYFFLMFKYPQDFNGVQILKTPEIL
jgi:hypothetical protein